MIIDFSQSESLGSNISDEVYDACICGAGFAGIVLSLTLGKKGKRVLLLEGGGLEPTTASQELYEGYITGQGYYDLDTVRLRYLGGSSNHWGGFCRPLDDYDFERRDYIPGSGWPISKADLNPYLSRACDFLQIHSAFGDDPVLEGSHGNFKRVHFEFGYPPVRIGEKYRGELEQSKNITLILNANLIDIRLNDNLSSVESFEITNQKNTKKAKFKGRYFALCLGGIENPRALLNASSQLPGGIGNQRDFVGRYFMDHPHFNLGFYILNQDLKKDAYRDTQFIAPTKKLMDRDRITNCGIRVYTSAFLSETWSDRIKAELKVIGCSDTFISNFIDFHLWCTEIHQVNAGMLFAAWEQVPNPESRVKLVPEKDRLGQRKAALNWIVSATDRATARTAGFEFGKYLAASNQGRVKLFDWVLNDGLPLPTIDEEESIGFHHMGTTRMGASQADGVVDGDCKVFGLENLFIGGSSVFRTSGHANPTLTIVQLAFRLADHLNGLIQAHGP